MSIKVESIPNPAIYGRGIKLMCFDVDGTLVSSEGTIGSRTLAQIDRVRKTYGVTVALATGRPLFSADSIIDQIGARGASMFFAGAFIVDVETRIPAFECHLSKAEAVEIVKLCRSHDLTLELYTGEEYFVDQITELTQIHADDYLHTDPQVVDLLKLAEREKFLKAVIMRPRDIWPTLPEDLGSKIKDSVISSATGAKHPNVYFHNITNAYASRKQAFQALIEQHRVRPDQVMSFGDSTSDIDFIKLSGVGVAMANAPASVHEAANLIAPSVEDDGIGRFLEMVFD